MVSKFSLFSNLLLVSAALGDSSSRFARRRANRQSHWNHRVESVNADLSSNAGYSVNWAGAVVSEGAETFTTVTGTFTIPTLAGNDGSTSAWVGIDGDSCQNAILQAGVDFTISGGELSFDAWYEWYPDDSYYFPMFTISAGDVVAVTVNASSTTSGTAIIENLTSGQIALQDITSSSALCRQDAEWIVEDFRDDNGSLVPFADFGSVTFSGVTASGPGGTYTPSSANLLDIMQNGQALTSVSASGSSLTVEYV